MKEIIFFMVYIAFKLLGFFNSDTYMNKIADLSVIEGIIAEQKDEKTDMKEITTVNSSTDINKIHDNNLSDLETMNKYEYYPLDLVYDDNDEYITSISGVFSEIKVLSSEDALYSIYSVKSLLGLEDPVSQLVLDRADEGTSGNCYTFQQYYNSIMVWMCNITISVDTEGKTCSLQSYLIPNKILKNAIATTTPRLSESDIIKIVKERYPKATDISSTLVIYKLNMYENPVLAYYCLASSKDKLYIGNSLLIDANTARIIQEGSFECE